MENLLSLISEPIDIIIEQEQSPYPTEQSELVEVTLPTYEPIPHIPTLPYNNLDGKSFVELIDKAYSEIVNWKKNLFLVPTSNKGKELINELAQWLDQFNKNTTFKFISLKVFMVLPSLLLQKPSATSKTKDHIEKLTLRLALWKERKIDELISEGKVIQIRLTSGKRKERDDIERVFAKLMFEGKINAPLRYLTENNDHGTLPSTPETIKELKKKHPEPAKIFNDALVTGPKQKIQPSYFDKIDEGLIQKAAKKTKGAAGPSHFDSEQFRRILCNKHFKAEGKHLREQIAIFAKDISINITDPECFESYVACRLIPLNKNPGVRPIGAGGSAS